MALKLTKDEWLAEVDKIYKQRNGIADIVKMESVAFWTEYYDDGRSPEEAVDLFDEGSGPDENYPEQ